MEGWTKDERRKFRDAEFTLTRGEVKQIVEFLVDEVCCDMIRQEAWASILSILEERHCCEVILHKRLLMKGLGDESLKLWLRFVNGII